MNRLQIYKLLRRNVTLSERRSPMLEQSTVAKVMMWIGGCLIGAYMLLLGVLFGKLASEEETYSILFLVLPVFLLIDFFLRFIVQQTPLMLVKPYVLLPMPRHAVIESFLLSSVFSAYNLLWLCLFLPYCLIIALGGASALEVLAVLLSGMLMVMANSQWYLMIRTLVARSLLWWVLPLALYAAYFLPMALMGKAHLDDVMDGLLELASSWWFPLLWLAVLAGLLMLNRWMQFRFVYEELAREQKKAAAMKHVAQLSFLERFGLVGEYLKLEMKSIMRNKAIRSRVIMSLALIVLLSSLIAYTDVYNNKMMLNFWCYYCYAIYGMSTLTKIMGPEGNYIELLMSHRENILLLLRAKFYFYTAILIIPFVIMLPAVFTGKFSILMMLAYLLLSSGLMHFIMFQLAVTNKQTLPLDAKMIGKNNVESGYQLVIELVGMLMPLLLVGGMLAFLSEEAAYLVMSAIGLLFTLAHPLWLRSIYNRMMRRKYRNLEGFLASR